MRFDLLFNLFHYFSIVGTKLFYFGTFVCVHITVYMTLFFLLKLVLIGKVVVYVFEFRHSLHYTGHNTLLCLGLEASGQRSVKGALKQASHFGKSAP